jgi:hypothetical protein
MQLLPERGLILPLACFLRHMLAPDNAEVPHWVSPQVSTGAFRGEQLTYIAALAANVPLVFGDRPKDVTYRWGGKQAGAHGALPCC